ncbi:MAG: hypothetical protein DPW18_04100 [Chloroflexi bacterium]|nr:hypothetical protein [Chloroflexota bacterium]MDL1941199.1 hypothetical protein [Chloroflexi bacterium CFX2]
MKKTSLLVLAFLLAACNFQVPQSPALRFIERKSGLIAYIGNDGNVYVTDQGATSTTPLTEDVTEATRSQIAYQLPTWSPDGSRVAFVRLEQTGADSLSAELMVADTDGDTLASVYASETELPFYINWSPDNENIGILSTTASRQTLALQSIPASGEARRVLDTGSPFYWSWSPDGRAMIVHKNGAAAGTQSQLSFLKLDDEVTEFVMDEIPASFQAPAWSPDGSFILLTTLSENGSQQIVLADAAGSVQKTIAEFEVNASFAWAADGEQFAYILGNEQLQNGALGPLHVGDVFGSEEVIVDEDVAGFFWSPDGGEIAYFLPQVFTPEDSSEQVFYLEMYILDVASSESRLIATFQPTQQFFSLLPYMDQYHQSVTIWSPDSNNLVIAFIASGGVPAIAIVPASGVTEPRLLAEGVFAAWSWK